MRKIIKLILLVVNILLAVLLLASTMAGKVSPSSNMVFSLLSYGYLYLLIANVVMAVVWLAMKSWLFLLPLLAMVVRLSYIPLYFQVGGTDSVEAESGEEYVKVMTFNVHHFDGVEGKDDVRDSNMRAFLAIVDEEQPQLIAMQEYEGRGKSISMTDELSARGYGHMASGYDNNRMSGEVIFSKLPILRVVRIEGPSKLYANLLWNEDTLRLYCLHLGSYGLDESDQRQISDIQHGNVDSLTGRGTLQKFRRTILSHEKEWNVLEPYFEKHKGMAVLAGDFNETPASYFYQRSKVFFVDSYLEAGQGFSTTYHGTFTRNRATTFPAFRIDMVLHSPNLEAVAYKRIKSEISDHHPVVATIKRASDGKNN